MPAKRAHDAPTTPNKRQKGKQARIDTFFSSPRTPVRAPAASPPSPEVIIIDGPDDTTDSPKAGPSTAPSHAPPPAPSSRTFSLKSSHAALSYPSLTTDALTFDVLQVSAQWTPGAPVPYSFLAHTLKSVSETRSRIAITNALTNCLRVVAQHHPASLLPAVYLLSNTVAPSYVPVELGLGASISKSIQQISGLSSGALRDLYNNLGDVGDVAFAAKSKVRTLIPHPPLLVTGVYQSLLAISRCKGQGAVKEKQKIVEKLLIASKDEETRFLARTLTQNLRVGAVRTTILTALSRAFVLTSRSDGRQSGMHAPAVLLASVKTLASPSKSQKKPAVDDAREQIIELFDRAEGLVKQVYVRHPCYEDIIAALLKDGLDGLEQHVSLAVGIPLMPTLGSPTRSLDEVFNILQDHPFAAELKYDGQRAQIHGQRNDEGRLVVHIFSRHLENMTTKYPDVVHMFQSMCGEATGASSFIMDSEIVALDPSTGALKTFQELSNRARKDVQLGDVRVAVGVFAFDLMYLDGQELIGLPFRERRAMLNSQFLAFVPEEKGIARFSHVECCDSQLGRDAIEEFMVKATESRCEGLMIKLLDSCEVEERDAKKAKTRRKPFPATYEPDKRTAAWLKLKKDYITGLGDSFDLVPVGAWHGNGRKAKWWSPILLALRAADGELVAVCKCMSGFTDAFYKGLNDRYSLNDESTTSSRQPLWGGEFGGFKPDVYFRPHEVWEVRVADVTISPVSLAAKGLVSQARGLSLRFPRYIKTREDKGIEQVMTAGELARVYEQQEARGRHDGGNDEGDLLDVDIDGSVPASESDST
ncbi:ATP-dependent DNA ligase [Schizophyllum amplum]|uniref:DNA ligase n=1 Tax=Schizophyllum amplum TaxID=97359 RepID=A0A550CXG8_9AGAR|nr:ATP-dependent DNA ligase [Auriculariopsis ampla]